MIYLSPRKLALLFFAKIKQADISHLNIGGWVGLFAWLRIFLELNISFTAYRNMFSGITMLPKNFTKDRLFFSSFIFLQINFVKMIFKSITMYHLN